MFKVGDEVEWESQSRGSRKFKRGIVVAIVPAGCAPDLSGLPDYRTSGIFGLPRRHESYIIRKNDSKVIYWPRVKHLQGSKQTRFV